MQKLREACEETGVGCRSCFRLARENSIGTITFPAISTGAYRYPLIAVTEIALREAKRELSGPTTIREVHFVCFDQHTKRVYKDSN
ncbi:MAG: hypothetical protein DCC75_12965 [Proteobacteria bacterium]|nr:MAG: hypothetical protein DCC75_12965 [Pseudomonadota bacterium]